MYLAPTDDGKFGSHEQPACHICQGHTCRLGTRRMGSIELDKEEQEEGTP